LEDSFLTHDLNLGNWSFEVRAWWHAVACRTKPGLPTHLTESGVGSGGLLSHSQL